MDFGLAFSYPFQDQDWLKKLGIAGLLMIIPVFGWLVVAGWAIEITRRVIRHDMPLLLPDWNDFGKYIVDGLYLCLIQYLRQLRTSGRLKYWVNSAQTGNLLKNVSQ
jgi:uncharacterized membrane protein